jgi:hypothetical protein
MRAECGARGYSIAPDDLVRADVAALLLGQSERTLANWRGLMEGPAFVKRGRAIWYAIGELARFETERRVTASTRVYP